MKRAGLALIVLLWAGSVFGAILWQDRDAAAPGVPAVAPMHWPGGAALPFHRGQFNLLVFVHPQCPCSRATLSELARLTMALRGRVDTRVVVLQYAKSIATSAESPRLQQARAIPGVSTTLDPQGELARRFSAVCSGQTLLYDPAGRLLFSGGITPARGHEGDNAGRAAVLRLVGGSTAAGSAAALSAATPVYGCPLFDDALPGLEQPPRCHR